MAIGELGKPENQWCSHFKQGAGCTIYETRPTECRTFVCGWLVDPRLDDRWKPTTARFLIWQQDGARRVVIEVDPAFPQAWKREPYYSTFKAWSDRKRPNGAEIMVKVGQRGTVIFPERDIDIGVLQDRPLKSGYAVIDGAYQPYARYE